jgi:hypothetical protein
MSGLLTMDDERWTDALKHLRAEIAHIWRPDASTAKRLSASINDVAACHGEGEDGPQPRSTVRKLKLSHPALRAPTEIADILAAEGTIDTPLSQVGRIHP